MNEEFFQPTAEEVIASIRALPPNEIIGQCFLPGGCAITLFLDRRDTQYCHLVYPDGFHAAESGYYAGTIIRMALEAVDERMVSRNGKDWLEAMRPGQREYDVEQVIRSLGSSCPLNADLNRLALLFDSCGVEGKGITAAEFLSKIV